MVQRDTQWLIIVVIGLGLVLGSGLAPTRAPSLAAAVALEAPLPVASESAVQAPADMEEEEVTLPDILTQEAEKSEEDAAGGINRDSGYMKEVRMTLDCVNM